MQHARIWASSAMCLPVSATARMLHSTQVTLAVARSHIPCTPAAGGRSGRTSKGRLRGDKRGDEAPIATQARALLAGLSVRCLIHVFGGSSAAWGRGVCDGSSCLGGGRRRPCNAVQEQCGKLPARWCVQQSLLVCETSQRLCFGGAANPMRHHAALQLQRAGVQVRAPRRAELPQQAERQPGQMCWRGHSVRSMPSRRRSCKQTRRELTHKAQTQPLQLEQPSYALCLLWSSLHNACNSRERWQS